MVLLAAILAMALYPAVQPLFTKLSGKAIPSLRSFPFYYLLFLMALVILVGIAAGLYPALVLSSLKSSDAVKGKLASVADHIWLRKLLAGLQFCLASIVLIAALVVAQQVAYFFGNSLGYNKDYVVSSQVPRDWTPEGVLKMEAVRNQFVSLPGVAHVTLSYEIPDGMNGGQGQIYKAGTDSTTAISAQLMNTDEYFTQTYGIPVKEGSYFTAANNSDPTKVVINEAAAKALGWSSGHEALGRQVRFFNFEPACTIIGVTADYHFNSMQQKIPPMVFGQVQLFNAYRYLSFKLKPGNISRTINSIENKWAQLLPGSSFEYRFMDDTLKRVYRTELQLKQAAYTAALLSLLIVLLGIIGVVSLNIQKLTREMGIRKILGASVSHIITLFIKDFFSVMVVAGLLACPIAWLVMKYWLNNYAYRIPLTPAPFLWSVGSLISIIVLLIILQTTKAGLANPVKNLRTE